MPYTLQSEYIGQQLNASLASDLVVGTAGVKVGDTVLTNTSGAVEVVTFRDSADTLTLGVFQIPANSTRVIPGADYSGTGLLIQGTANVTVTGTVYAPNAKAQAWSMGGVSLAESSFSTAFNDTATSNDNRAVGPTDTTLHGAAPVGTFSASFWYRTTVGSFLNAGLMGSAPNASFAAGWAVVRGANATSLKFWVGSGASGHDVDWSPVDPWDNAWHHLAISFDAPNRQYTQWLDGVKDQSAIDVAPVSRPLGNGNVYGMAGDFSANFGQDCRIDTGAYWLAKILSDLEVENLYNSGVPTDPTTVVDGANWYLIFGDDPSDDATIGSGQITDQTANGNHFTPQGDLQDTTFVADTP